MRNITFRADEDLIEAARARARAESSTLNAEFRKWLAEYARGNGDKEDQGALRENRNRHVAGERDGNQGRRHRSVTLSADEALIDAARERASREGRRLGSAFQRWIRVYSRGQRLTKAQILVLLDQFDYADSGGRKFTRDEMNDR